MSSNIDHLAGAIRRGPQAMAHAGVSVKGGIYPHQPVRHSDGSTTNFPASSALVLHQSEIDTVFGATTATENAFSSGGFVDVRIAAGSTGIVTAATLEMRVRAGSGGVTVLPVPFLFAIDRVELLAEGGNTLVSSHQATQLIWPFRHLPQAAIDMLQGPMGFYSDVSATSGSYPSSILNMSPDEEQTFYCPLLENPFALNHVFVGALRSDCYLRVWMKGPTAFLVSSGPMPTLKSMNLILTQQSLSPRDRVVLSQKYASESLDFRFQRPGYQVIRATMGPSQRYAWQLTAVLGLITEMVISVMAPGSPSFYKVSSFELLDGSGASVIGGSAINTDYAVFVKGARRQQSRSLAANSISWAKEERSIILEFGSSRDNMQAGVVTGYMPMDGSFQLAITTPATGFTAGDYEIRVEYLSCARLNVNRGVVSVYPS